MSDESLKLFDTVPPEIRTQGAHYLESSGLKPDQLERLEALGYFAAPASKGHHLAKAGGLFEHSTNVTRRLLRMTGTLDVEWPRMESPYLIGMLHDLVKAQCYRPDGNGGWTYVDTKYPGHGSASVDFIEKDLGVRLNEVERLCVRWHMGAFNLTEGSLENYSRALDRFPRELIATHTADIAAARIDENWDGNAPDGSRA